MARFVDQLLEFGFAKPNPSAKWASAPLLVRKPGKDSYRMTFDLRRVNQCTVPIVWPMPHIESELLDLQSSSIFVNIDFCAGYWQLPLDKEKKHIHSFITPNGEYQPTRTLQRGMNSVQNFQSRVEPCFHEIRESVKAWIDDIALHEKTEQKFIQELKKFFITCREQNFKISIKKYNMYENELKCCGFIVDTTGINCDPRRLESLKNGHPPTNAAKLSRFVHCLHWMSKFIPQFTRRVTPLKQILEEAYKKFGKRTTNSIKNITLTSVNWSLKHMQAFEDLKHQMIQAVKLAHRDYKKELCV